MIKCSTYSGLRIETCSIITMLWYHLLSTSMPQGMQSCRHYFLMLRVNLFFRKEIYRVCRSGNSRIFVHRFTVFMANSDNKWWSRFSIEVYASEPVFSLPCVSHCSNVQTVSEKQFCLGPKKSVGVIIFHSEVRIVQGRQEPPFIP